MRAPGKLRAMLIRDRFRPEYDLLLGTSGPRPVAATSVGVDGRVVYTDMVEAAVFPTLLRLTQEEVDAILESMDGQKPEDATHDAMLDARATRDRLLAMFEARGIR